MAARVDPSWAQRELIPFLNTVFPKKSAAEWEMYIRHAEMNMYNIDFYENFPSTIERLRLSLINPTVLTEAETKQFARIKKDMQMCVTIFVRHAILHETYSLFSLGTAPSRILSRPHIGPAEEEKTETSEVGTAKVEPDNLSGENRDGQNAKEENVEGDNAGGMMHAADDMHHKAPVRDDEALGVGHSVPQTQRKGKSKGKGKWKPRGYRSTGFGRRTGPASSHSGDEMLPGYPAYPGHTYEARYDSTAGPSNMPFQMAAERTGVWEYNFQDHHHTQFGPYGMQPPVRQWVGPVTGFRSMPSYPSSHVSAAPPSAYYDPSYQSDFFPAAVSWVSPQDSYAPFQGHTQVPQTGAGSHALRGEAKDFLPGAFPQGF